MLICGIYEIEPEQSFKKIAIGRKMKCAVNHSCKKGFLDCISTVIPFDSSLAHGLPSVEAAGRDPSDIRVLGLPGYMLLTCPWRPSECGSINVFVT